MDKHIVSNYDNDLELLKNMIIEMGVMLEKQVFLAVEIIKVSNDEISKSIIEDHGGSIHYAKNASAGSVFYFTLPVV